MDANKKKYIKLLDLPVLKSSSCLTSTASLTFLLGCPNEFSALLTDGAVISENFALYILRSGFTSVHTLITSKPIFSPSLSQSVHIINP